MSENGNGLWFYYYKDKKVKIGPIHLDVLCAELVNKKIELDQIYLAQSKWPQWKNGIEVPEFVKLYQDITEEAASSPPLFDDELIFLPPIDTKEATTSNLSLVSVEATIEDKNSINKPNLMNELRNNKQIESRKHPRVSMELKAIFVVDKKSFRTKTINLSLGGIKITDPLPKIYFDREIEVYLSSLDLKFSIKFVAILAGNKSTGQQIQFTRKNDAGIKHLEAWILTLNSNKKMLPTKKIA